jgi:hypothetical protein
MGETIASDSPILKIGPPSQSLGLRYPHNAENVFASLLRQSQAFAGQVRAPRNLPGIAQNEIPKQGL